MRTSDVRRLVRAWQGSRDEKGASALLVALVVAAIVLPLAAISVDVSKWYVMGTRIQVIADAASTAGVTYLPDDLPAARARAIEVATLNGFDPATDEITVERGGKPTQLKVTVARRVGNAFGAGLGMDTTVVERSAVADYNGPAPMGSPCNTFGNEPAGTPLAGPAGSVLSVPPDAQCSSKPEFWASINGPDIHKTQGERFAARTCAGNEDGCNVGRQNLEFDPLGYFYVVRVEQAGQPVTIQIYDPAAVPTGQQCQTRPAWTPSNGSNANPYTPSDAVQRYGVPPYWNRSTYVNGPGDPSMCTGDDDMRASTSLSSETPTVTSFGLREPSPTQVPAQGAPIASCAKQFRGVRSGEINSSALWRSGSGYKAELASVFHQWVTLCTFTPTQVGDYYLQVRNNVRYAGSSTSIVHSGNMQVFTQTGDDTSVRGSSVNSFGLRAFSPGGQVSIAAWKAMRIYANGASATSTFNLVRIVPAAQGKTLNFGFFDVGEAAGAGTMTVLPPTDSNLATATNCRATGYRTQALSGCSLPIDNTFNGKQQQIRVPIPNTYTCNWHSQGGCWWRVKVDFGAAKGVNDATTWTAEIEGEPVRLVE